MEGDKRFPKMSQASESKMGEEREFERESTARFDDRTMTRRGPGFRIKFACLGTASSRAIARALQFFHRRTENYGLVGREGGPGRAWMAKIRPWWGHNYYFHVRLSCPSGSPQCRGQAPPPPGDGCGKELDWWF